MSTNSASLPTDPKGWRSLKNLSRYHWFVFLVACLAWDLDCMDQQLFILARKPAMNALLEAPTEDPAKRQQIAEKLKVSVDSDKVTKAIKDAKVNEYAGYATSIFLIGWAIGGLGFGIMGDRAGRVRTLMTTILLYSVFTGLSAFSVGFMDFALYRFLTGLGVGGVFAVAVSLVAETVPNASRPYMLGLLQASSVIGNVAAALINIGLGSLEGAGTFKDATFLGFEMSPWRIMFVIGIVPSILVLVIQGRLKEPEKWQASKNAGVKAGQFSELLGSKYKRNALFGLMLAFAGVVGLWGIGFFAPDLQQTVFKAEFVQQAEAQGLTGEKQDQFVSGKTAQWAGITSLMINGGAFFGIYGFTWFTGIVGRKPAFAVFFLAAAGSTLLVFLKMKTFGDIFWMLPLMGFCQLGLFGGYAIYFPELFPTRLRSTGTSFCYNVGRLVAASGPAVLGLLTSSVFSAANGYTDPGEPARYAGAVMCSVFGLGLIALVFLPETKDKPLPE
ncbi:MAG: MFS transporter [Zavarzinella sp.]